MSEDHRLSLRLSLLSPALLKEALLRKRPAVTSIVVEILLRVLQTEEAVGRVMDREVLKELLQQLEGGEVELVLGILEVVQGVLGREEEALRQELQEGGVLERLQEHPNDDVYQTTVAIMKQHFHWERE